MARKNEQDEAGQEIFEALDYLTERAQRALDELKRKQARREVTKLKASPLPKSA
jgi:hypothetical protein